MSQAIGPQLGPAPKPLRVGLVAGRRTPEHLGAVIRHVAVGLLEELVQVTLVCPEGMDAAGIPVPPVDILPYKPPRLPVLRPRAVRGLAGAVRSAGVTLLHALDGDALALTRRLAAAAELEYLAGLFSLRPDGHVAEARCRGVLAAGQPVLLALERCRAAAGQTFHLVRPGVYLARRAACFTDPQHAPALIAAGPLRSFQPFAAVLEGFARLRAAGHDAVLFLVGNGRCETPLRRLGEKLGLRADLTFVDRPAGEPLNDILTGADVFIAPVPYHRVDIDLLSAMAAGVPALTAGAEACDFVIPDRTALTFAAGDAGELAAGLAGLLEDRAFARGLAEAALAHLREHHSPARMAQQLAGIYRSVAAGRTAA